MTEAADRFAPIRKRVAQLDGAWCSLADLVARGITGPAAEFIYNARIDVVDLLNEVDRLRTPPPPTPPGATVTLPMTEDQRERLRATVADLEDEVARQPPDATVTFLVAAALRFTVADLLPSSDPVMVAPEWFGWLLCRAARAELDHQDGKVAVAEADLAEVMAEAVRPDEARGDPEAHNARQRLLEALGLPRETAKFTAPIGTDPDEPGWVPAVPGEETLTVAVGGKPPAGWRWCPDCNGDGVISTMDGGPNLNESERDCGRCATTQGMVPVAAPLVVRAIPDPNDPLRFTFDPPVHLAADESFTFEVEVNLDGR